MIIEIEIVFTLSQVKRGCSVELTHPLTVHCCCDIFFVKPPTTEVTTHPLVLFFNEGRFARLSCILINRTYC